MVADRLSTRWAEIQAVGRALPSVLRALGGGSLNAAQLLEERAARRPEDLGLRFPDRSFTWREIDAAVNRTATALQQEGVGPGDVVVLLMDNRPEYLFVVTALSRLRALAALVNTSISGSALAHAIRIASAKRIVVGSEHATKLSAVLPELGSPTEKEVFEQRDPESEDGYHFASFDERVAAAGERPPSPVSVGGGHGNMCYIYTSGTTGLPKAAVITDRRFLVAGAAMGRGVYGLTEDDVSYVPLPLYHSVALLGGWAGALTSGACLASRRRFSASRFWHDVQEFGATVFIYIGELCRYLLNQGESPEERGHRLRLATGNGLRPDIWRPFQERFRIPLIREYYGATESPVVLVNLSGREGMVGRLVFGNEVVRCDLESGEVRRNAAGRCERVVPGEAGLLLFKIGGAAVFDGYLDRSATRKKVLENVFKPGDRYFNSGDLLTLHEDGWLSFSDRVGDTFRWKGENVSTNEVGEILNGAPGVLESNVYGVKVPDAEGRAGMASLHVDETFSIVDFGKFVLEKLPAYQRPYFVRLQKGMRITGTMKHQKVDYRREGFDPDRVHDPLYLLDGDHYVVLDAETYEGLQSGRIVLR